MSTVMFFGYYSFISKYYQNSNNTPEDIKNEKVAEVDWNDEVKKLKRKLNGNRKTINTN